MPSIDAELAAFDDAGGRMVRILSPIWRWIKGQKALRREVEAARHILGIDPRHAPAYRHSSAHSRFSLDSPHPDNSDALFTAASLDLARARNRKRLAIVDELVVGIEKSMVLLGSPTAEALSRAIFGYDPAPDFEDALVQTAPPLDLPFRWVLDPERLNPGATAARLVRGHGWASRPNWRLSDERTKKPYIPRVDNEGILESDFLLVTRMRNFLTDTAWQRGRYIVSFGGTHGTGTRAIDLLLGDEPVLAQVREELGDDPTSYQLLFEVGHLTHKEKEGTRATSSLGEGGDSRGLRRSMAGGSATGAAEDPALAAP